MSSRVARSSDAELLRLVAAGSSAGFDRFVELWGRRLLAFGLRMCGQREDAEEVFQETLLKAYVGLAQLRDPAALRAWLFRVAANQCRMLRRKPQERELGLDEALASAFDEGAAESIRDWSAQPEAMAERGELRRHLEQALRGLPPEVRIAVLLRDVEGLSTKEAAEALGLTPSALKMRVHRGRLALRQRLGELFEREVA